MTLFAKSRPTNGDASAPTLEEHLTDVSNAAIELFDHTVSPRLFSQWFRFFRISESVSDRFTRTLRAAAALHDYGKANDGFQAAVGNSAFGAGEQGIRHEHLSALLIHEPSLWQWLKQDSLVDWPIILAAVLTHHEKCVDKNAIVSLSPSRKMIRVVADLQLREHLGGLLGRNSEIPVSQPFWTFDSALRGTRIDDAVGKLDDELDELDCALRGDKARARLLRAVRAALICADAAASGLRRENLSLSEWIRIQFADTALCDCAYIDREVIQKRIEDLKAQRKWGDWHKFQLGASTQPSRTLLLAPCGAGKTLAAWKWIAQQARTPVKRVIFLYPTRATATEGFKDYVSWAPEADASLIHGTGAYELDGMFSNPDDDRSKKDFESDPRLFAIGHWSKRVFSATVDQFLAFLHHAYGPTCLLPVLADSIVVIDEVHSFDESMFGTLKRFLQEFDVPVLCMTATMLNSQRHQLEHLCGLKVYEDRPDDLAKIADAPRYRIQCQTRNEIDQIVAAALLKKKRVLWVVNQVSRAQTIARQFGPIRQPGQRFTPAGDRVLCYHSRFTLDDRKVRHREVVNVFKPAKDEPDRAVLAVTTQVCEMSLDLDADVLITELCPVTSLVQRMGRCNRKACVPASVGDVYVYQPDNEMPYEKDDIRSAQNFISDLSMLPAASQTDLEQALQKHGKRPAPGDRHVPFVSCDPYADGRNDPFRDIDERSDQGCWMNPLMLPHRASNGPA